MMSMGACGGKGVYSSTFDDTMSNGGVIERFCLTCCGAVVSEGGVREALCRPSCKCTWNCWFCCCMHCLSTKLKFNSSCWCDHAPLEICN